MKASIVCIMIVILSVIAKSTSDAAAVPDTGNQQNQLLVDGIGDGLQQIDSRMIRGIVALKKLLRDAKYIPSKAKNIRVYQKAGDFRTALEEFRSMKPVDIGEVSSPSEYRVVYGNVEDRLVLVAKNGEGGQATLTILKRAQNPIGFKEDKIIYTD